MAAPTVSVLLPIYNAEPYLAQAIESVLAQTYTDFELLLINDGSTDQSRQIAAQYTDARIRLLDNPHNMGLIATLNRGLAAARGTFIARQDADDIWEPQLLEYALDYLYTHPHVALVGARARLIDAQGQPITNSFMPYIALDDCAARWYLLFENPFVHGNVVYRRDLVWDTFGGYDPSYPHIEDYALWSRIAQHAAVTVLDHELSSFRKARGSVTARTASTEDAAARQIMMHNLQHILQLATFPEAWLDLLMDFRTARRTNQLERVRAFGLLVETLLARFTQIYPQAQQHPQIRHYTANLLARAAYHGAVADRHAAGWAYRRAMQYDPTVVQRIPLWKFAARWLGGEQVRHAFKTAQAWLYPPAVRPLAFYIPSLDQRYGGAERSMVTMANALAQQGMPVDLVLIRPAAHFRADIDPAVRVVDLGGTRRGLLALPRVWFYLRTAQPRICIGTLPPDNLTVLWAAWLARLVGAQRVRVVMQHHNTVAYGTCLARSLTRQILPLLMRWCYPFADAIIAVSYGLQDEIRRSLGQPLPQVRVIYNPTVRPELATYAAAALDEVWLNDKTVPVLLGVGRLTAQKDFPNLLRAVALVRQQQPVRLIILGEGDERPALEALIGQLGLQDAVKLAGYTSNPYAYMARADLFVLSSESEGLPGVLIEAMACGTPVVATDCEAGPREVLADGQYGPLVPVGDSVALAQAMIATLAAPLPPDVLQARAQVFSVDAAVANYRLLFRELAGS